MRPGEVTPFVWSLSDENRVVASLRWQADYNNGDETEEAVFAGTNRSEAPAPSSDSRRGRGRYGSN